MLYGNRSALMAALGAGLLLGACAAPTPVVVRETVEVTRQVTLPPPVSTPTPGPTGTDTPTPEPAAVEPANTPPTPTPLVAVVVPIEDTLVPTLTPTPLVIAVEPLQTPTLVNFVANGSFEQPVLNSGDWQALPSIPGWTLSSGSAIEVWNALSGWSCAWGDQCVELDSNGSSAIYQDIATTPGRRYRISIVFSARPGTAESDNLLEISWDGVPVATPIAEDGSALADLSWRYYSFAVTAQSNSSRLELRDVGASNGLGTIIDNVSVTAH